MYLINIIDTTGEPDIITQIIDGTYHTNKTPKNHNTKIMKTVKIINQDNIECQVSVDELANQIADIYNSRTAGWDFQHCGQSRNYEAVEEITNKLESTLFCGSDIKHAIERDIDMVIDMNDVMTLDAWAEFVADAVAQRIAKINYGDVTFIIYLKK